MTQKKKQKGFTLVEVIVVAVIVAVLAAVAVPIYLNYVSDSKANQANNIAGAVASYCGACEVDGGSCPAGAQAGPTTLTCGSNTSTIEVPADFTVTIALPAPPLPGTSDCVHADGQASATHRF